MNFLRHNIITLALVVVVAGVTALNSFTLTTYLAEFHMNNSDLIAQVAFSESNRCDRLEATLDRLWRDHINVRKAANELAEEVRMCHELLEKAGIKSSMSENRET